MNAIMTTDATEFQYKDIVLAESVHINGLPYATRKSLGVALGYADPQKAMDNLAARYPFIESYRVPLKLRGTDGKEYDTKVYHPIGQLLFFMKSDKPIAEQMQIQMAEFIWNKTNSNDLNSNQELAYRKQLNESIKALSRTKDALEYNHHKSLIVEMSSLLGRPMPDLSLAGKSIDELEGQQS